MKIKETKRLTINWRGSLEKRVWWKVRDKGRKKRIGWKNVRYWIIWRVFTQSVHWKRKKKVSSNETKVRWYYYDDGSTTCLAFSCKVSHHRNQYHHCHSLISICIHFKISFTSLVIVLWVPVLCVCIFESINTQRFFTWTGKKLIFVTNIVVTF